MALTTQPSDKKAEEKTLRASLHSYPLGLAWLLDIDELRSIWAWAKSLEDLIREERFPEVASPLRALRVNGFEANEFLAIAYLKTRNRTQKMSAAEMQFLTQHIPALDFRNIVLNGTTDLEGLIKRASLSSILDLVLATLQNQWPSPFQTSLNSSLGRTLANLLVSPMEFKELVFPHRNEFHTNSRQILWDHLALGVLNQPKQRAYLEMLQVLLAEQGNVPWFAAECLIRAHVQGTVIWEEVQAFLRKLDPQAVQPFTFLVNLPQYLGDDLGLEWAARILAFLPRTRVESLRSEVEAGNTFFESEERYKQSILKVFANACERELVPDRRVGSSDANRHHADWPLYLAFLNREHEKMFGWIDNRDAGLHSPHWRHTV